MNNSYIFSSTGVNSPAPSARKNASVDINNKKRSSYSFTLARVGLEEELDNFLLEKTAKGTGLTVSNYIRDLINRDYRGQLNGVNNNTSISGGNDMSPVVKDVIINTKNNTDAILRLISNLNLDSVNIDNLTSINTQKAENNYDFDKILSIISDKLSELHEIKTMLSNIGVAKGDSSTAQLESIIKVLDNQNEKIDRLESKLDDNFETIIELLKNKSVLDETSSDSDNETENNTSEADRIKALLANDIEDDDE